MVMLLEGVAWWSLDCKKMDISSLKKSNFIKTAVVVDNDDDDDVMMTMMI